MVKVSRKTGSNAKSKSNKKKTKKTAPPMKVKAPPKDNPFETIWSRRKFDILGKKRKGEQRRVGLARSRAIEKRKKTLLKEYEQSGKSSVFVDKRIGEKNDDLGEFDKAIMRSQRERQVKLSKKSKYNLSDGEEDELPIQGLGSFLERDDFDDGMLSDGDGDDVDDDDPDALENKKRSVILKHHANLNDVVDGEDNRQKSKKEVMEEIMQKSKYFKAQKAKDKEENEQLMEELDKDFSSLLQSGALSSLNEAGKMNASNHHVNKENDDVEKNQLLDAQKQEISNQDEPDSYDKLVNEMALEMRARPSERTKTAEEIAQEGRDRLERLEEERQKRMLAVDDSSDEENNDVEKPLAQKVKSISGDDLGDSFSLDDEPKARKGWVDEILERKGAEGSEDGDDYSSEDAESAEDDGDNEPTDDEDDDEDGENHVKDDTLKDWEQSDDDNLDIDLEEEEEDEEEEEEKEEKEEEDVNVADREEVLPRGSKKSKKTYAAEAGKVDREPLKSKKIKEDRKPHSADLDLPYIIEPPTSFEELCALVENRSNAKVMEAINNIRNANNALLKAENRKKMQVFYGVLLQYFAVLANKKPLNFELLNLLVKPLIEMSMQIPYFAAICARQRILRTRMQFCEAIKKSENGCWPSLKTLSLLRLWSMIFPCSDFRHVVMTPAILLMCEYLMRCRIMSGRDIAVGSLICSMVLSIAKQSQKFCPEALIFLQTMLMAATGREATSYQESQFPHVVELKALRSMLCLSSSVNDINPLNFLSVMDMPEDSCFFRSDKFRASVLLTVVETLRGFVDLYSGFSSFPELFSPILKLLLEGAQQESLPTKLQDKFKEVAQLIQKKADEWHMQRQPLQMRKQKPVPIKLLSPKFEENFVKGRDYDPDRERAERRKLKKQVKQEQKGAIREIRKDNLFLLGVKEKEKALLQEERAEQYGRAKAFLQEQEHAFRSGQLGKGRKRRR